MADIVLKDRNGNDIVYPGVTSIKLNTVDGGAQSFNACDEVEKTVAPDFSDGDFVVLPDTGTLLSKVTVEKPEALSSENIRKGKEIAGVTGDFIGDTEEVTVELALADGDQTVSPSADGKVISGVTIKKPETLTPANIAKGVEVAGVVGELAAETEEATVNLDFSNGDMEVTPTADKSFSKVNIPVPGTLIPENIAEGVDIAGIIGTLVAGGGGGNVVSSYQFVKVTNTPFTVAHGLGVTPDIVIAIHSYPYSCTANYIFVALGASTAYLAKHDFQANIGFYFNSNKIYTTEHTDGIDTTNNSSLIYGANSESVTFGSGNSAGLHLKKYYDFYFIAGLT